MVVSYHLFGADWIDESKRKKSELRYVLKKDVNVSYENSLDYNFVFPSACL